MSESPPRSVRAGLRRVAMDLHTHTPASSDWVDDAVMPDAIVQAALDAGLAAIAITDHQTGDWVDKVKAAAEKTDLVVFPGVEINNLAGSEGIHLVALFDREATSQDIDRFLAATGAVGGTGHDRRRETTTKGLVEVLDEIVKYKGIAILAHCQSTKGVLGELRGAVRREAIRHPAVLAAEAPASDFYDEGKKKSHKRTYDLLDGTDPDYQHKLAVFQSSDNPARSGGGHALAGIGQRFSYFYVEDPISLESLRQCFIDREVRIEYPAPGIEKPEDESRIGSPRISFIEVTGGFLDGFKLDLHPGLTTLIGAKGSGKSMLVELIRFVLNQPPSQDEIKKDHETKLKNRLGDYGKVSLSVVDPSGTEHRLTRTYDPANGNPYDEALFDVAEFFPCHLLSQGEIVRLAESESEQIRFIDSFFDFRAHQRAIDELKGQLADLDTQVALQIRSRKAVGSIEQEAKTLAERIQTIDKQLKSPVFGEYQKAQKKQQAVTDALTALGEFGATVAEARAAAGAVAIPDLPEELKSDPLVRRLNERVVKARDEVLKRYGETTDSVSELVEDAEKDRGAWTPDFQKIEREYNDTVQKSGGDTAKLNQERGRLVNAKASADGKLRKARQQAEQLSPTVERRNEAVEELKSQETAYTKKRQERCEWFKDKSAGKIQAKVDPGSNYQSFRQRLDAMKRGSYLSGDEVEAIAKSVAPDEFVRSLLRYDLSQKPTDLDPIKDAAGLSRETVGKLADFLLRDCPHEELLALQYSVTPTDRPEISYRMPDGTYVPLDQLSTGQKCTAFLIMMLCEGEIPIIVDQPEDSLDIRSIWEDMCKRLRTSKRTRQFVFTTHNSSLSVASDSDKFVVLGADGRKAELVMSGAIDSPDVRRDVIELLEGGEETYFLKQRKYNLESAGGKRADETDGPEDAEPEEKPAKGREEKG